MTLLGTISFLCGATDLGSLQDQEDPWSSWCLYQVEHSPEISNPYAVTALQVQIDFSRRRKKRIYLEKHKHICSFCNLQFCWFPSFSLIPSSCIKDFFFPFSITDFSILVLRPFQASEPVAFFLTLNVTSKHSIRLLSLLPSIPCQLIMFVQCFSNFSLMPHSSLLFLISAVPSWQINGLHAPYCSTPPPPPIVAKPLALGYIPVTESVFFAPQHYTSWASFNQNVSRGKSFYSLLCVLQSVKFQPAPV